MKNKKWKEVSILVSYRFLLSFLVQFRTYRLYTMDKCLCRVRIEHSSKIRTHSLTLVKEVEATGSTVTMDRVISRGDG